MEVLGISTDSVKSHAEFRASLELPFHLLADEGGEVSKAYDSLGLTGYSNRKIVLIEKGGRIAYRDEAYSVGDPKALEAIFTAIDALP